MFYNILIYAMEGEVTVGGNLAVPDGNFVQVAAKPFHIRSKRKPA